MSVPTVEQGGPWTLDDWFELNDSSSASRYELINGGLSVTPAPSFKHQWARDHVGQILRNAAPPELWVVTAVGVAIAGDLCSGALIPDVVVSHRTDRPRRIVPGETVELAVEVVSPSSRANDRRTKPLLYATAGIRHYWRIELDSLRDSGRSVPPIVLTYVLKDDDYVLTQRVYVLTQRVGAGGLVSIADPFDVEFDPAQLAAY